jgi:hypothetical protein
LLRLYGLALDACREHPDVDDQTNFWVVLSAQVREGGRKGWRGE